MTMAILVPVLAPALSRDGIDGSLRCLDSLADIEEGADDGRVEQGQAGGDDGGGGGVRWGLGWRQTPDKARGEKEENKQALQHSDTTQTQALLCKEPLYELWDSTCTHVLPAWPTSMKWITEVVLHTKTRQKDA